MPHIFISYAKKDTRSLAIQLTDALNAIEGITAWVDRSLRAGQSWEVQIQAQIDRCDAMVVLYSPDINRHKHGQDESYVLTEISYAKYTVRKPIIPVMAQRTEPPIALASAHYIDFTLDGLTLDDLVQALCDEVGVVVAPKISPEPSVSPPTPKSVKAQPGKDAPDFENVTSGQDIDGMENLAKPQTDEKPAPSTRESTSKTRRHRNPPNLPPEVIERARRQSTGEDVSADSPKDTSSEKKPGTLYQRIMDTTSKKKQSVRDILPSPFEWIEIPGGRGTMKTDESSVTLTIPTAKYWMSNYPITNAQFAKFIEAGGYQQEKWWTQAGWDAKAKGWGWNDSKSAWEETGIAWTEPLFWNDSQWNGAEHPVVGVSWYEAMAFCLWLSDITGEKILLPTEAQWQYAAQSSDGRAYPWGNRFDKNRCNTNESGIGKTTPVRQYEGKGDSPFDVVDMAGNVWEWCLNDYENPQIDPSKVDIGSADQRVLRGGSWFNFHDGARAVARVFDFPHSRDDFGGFRLCGAEVSVYATP